MPSEPIISSKLDAEIRRGHEGDDVWVRTTAIVALGMMVSIPIILVCLWIQYQGAAGSRYRGLTAPALAGPQSQPTKSMPEPRLETVPGANIAVLRAQEDAELNTYGWIDPSNNVIRIPIERAMELISQRGLPAPTGRSAGKSEYELILERSRDRALAPMMEAR
jgi:hypothetical protein